MAEYDHDDHSEHDDHDGQDGEFSSFKEELLAAASSRTSFNKLVKELQNELTGLFKFAHLMGSSSKTLSLPGPDGKSTFLTSKQLRDAEKTMIRNLAVLKYLPGIGTIRQERAPVLPESFSNIYSPVYLGDALKSFFSNPKVLGYVDPADPASGALIDKLPYVTAGITMRTVVNSLFYIAGYNQKMQSEENGQLITPSKEMVEAFGGKIPALYGQTVDSKGKSKKVANAEGLSTFDILVNKSFKRNTTFNPKQFAIFFFQALGALNIYMKEDIDSLGDDVKGYLNPFTAGGSGALNENGGQILAEFEIIRQTLDRWGTIMEPIKARRKAAKKEASKEAKTTKGRGAARA